jgi:hypothetical protein
VKVLQKEMQDKPFRDYEGKLVTLAASLQDDGILRMMFRNTHLVDLVLPNFRTAWLSSRRTKADVRALRNLIIRMPGHTPLLTGEESSMGSNDR